ERQKQIPCGDDNKKLLPTGKLLHGGGGVGGGGLGVFGRDDDGGGDLVVGVEVEELDAGGGAAGGADGFGVDADDFAELADEHHLGGVVDEVDGGDLA